MTAPPDALRRAYHRWVDAGHPGQQSFSWRPNNWIRRLTSTDIPRSAGFVLADCIETIVEKTDSDSDGTRRRIDRELVKDLHRPETLTIDGMYDQQAVVTAFLAAMIWGYGSTGYGPYRTARVLTSDPHAITHLTETAKRAQESPDGGLTAFTEIARSRRESSYLKYLGPAFGTKFLYFLTASSDIAKTTPVMDAVVRRWFRTHAGIDLTTGRWDTDSYRTYLESLDAWRDQFSGKEGEPLEREDLELLIFSSSRGDDADWDIAPESLSTDELLDLLQDDVDEIADITGSPDGPHLLRQLADWVAQSGAAEA